MEKNVVRDLDYLKIKALAVIKSAVMYMNTLSPLNNEQFMSPNELKRLKSFRDEIETIASKFDGIFFSLPYEDRGRIEYMNILGRFNHTLYEMDSLDPVSSSDDEFDLQRKFSKALFYGKKAVERKIQAEKDNNPDELAKSNRILNCCGEVFRGHFWGESYQNDLVKYEERVRTGRTTKDDINDYNLLIQEMETLAISYAKDLINGTIEDYDLKFAEIFAKEDELQRFMSTDEIRSLKMYSLRWIKLEVEKDPRAYLLSKGINPGFIK